MRNELVLVEEWRNQTERASSTGARDGGKET